MDETINALIAKYGWVFMASSMEGAMAGRGSCCYRGHARANR